MSLLSFICLLAFPAVGCICALLLKRRLTAIMPITLSFSGAFLLGVVLLHLAPTVFLQGGVSAGIWIAAGFVFQILIDGLSRGIEHGHMHASGTEPSRLIPGAMLGLCVHAFIEGLPLAPALSHGHAHHHEGQESISLMLGIALHKIPAAFALTALLVSGGKRRLYLILLVALFAVTTPIAGVMGHWLVRSFEGMDQLTIPLLSVALGSLLHVATTILFETGTGAHMMTRARWLALAAGLAVAGLIGLAEQSL